MTPGFPRLLAEARRDGVRVARAIARVGSALGDPGEPRPDETVRIDLEQPWLELRVGAEPLFGGPVNRVGTWTKRRGFRWGFAERGAPAAASAHVTAALRALGDLPELDLTTFAGVDSDDARVVTVWLAVRAGYTGVWPVRDGATISYLAVDLCGPTSLPAGRSPWCTACGRLRRAVGKLVAGPAGVAVCDRCIGTLAELVAERGPSDGRVWSPLDDSASPCLRFCQLCGELRGRLIMAGSMGVCGDCVEQCQEIVTAAR